MKKYIIAGGRDFGNYNALEEVLRYYKSDINEVVSGDAFGADSLGIRWAVYNNIPIKHFPADWNHYGKSAGFIRNADMGDYADAAICFWDKKSKGTAHMIRTMKLFHKPCYVYDYNGNLLEEF